MATRLTLFSLILGLMACGGDDHLGVRGDVSIAAPDGTPTGLVFTQNTRLVDEDFAGPGTDVIAGSCRIGTDAEGTEVVNLAVSRPNAVAEGFQIRRFRLQLPTEGGGLVEADLGGDLYRQTVGAGCDATLDYVQRGDGLVGVTFDCALDGAGGSASASGELFFEGCSQDN